MKTSVVIDKNKIQLAKKLGSASTLRELIDQALDAYIERARRLTMADLLGTGFFDGGSNALNKMRGRSGGRTRR